MNGAKNLAAPDDIHAVPRTPGDMNVALSGGPGPSDIPSLHPRLRPRAKQQSGLWEELKAMKWDA